MKIVFADTGFWAARFDLKDDHHSAAKAAVAALGQFRTLTTADHYV
jgi:predicted nucleic acid-binding protein